MKVTLDLAKLLAEGEISQNEYDRLLKLSAKDTGSLAFNIIIAFGVVAISGGLLAIFPSPYTSIVLGIISGSIGVSLGFFSSARWKVLSVVSTMSGALLMGGGIINIAEGSSGSFLLIAVIFLAAGYLARSGLLVAFAILAISSGIGVRTDYFHASYFLGIKEPGLTIGLFSMIAIATFHLSKILPHDLSRLSTIASRTSVFLVNFGFWIGSLWGDRNSKGEIIISDDLFVVAWAIALMATGIWGALQNRRWVVNTVAVFGGIHFYTQWFEKLGASPASIVVAGLLAIGGAVALRSLNSKLRGVAE